MREDIRITFMVNDTLKQAFLRKCLDDKLTTRQAGTALAWAYIRGEIKVKKEK